MGEPWCTLRVYDDTPPGRIPATIPAFFGDLGLHPGPGLGRARSPLYLPAILARRFVRITDVRAEKLGDITAHEAYMEGIDPATPPNLAVIAYWGWWDEIHGGNVGCLRHVVEPVWRIAFEKISRHLAGRETGEW